jgi:hypothetical protein
MSRRIIRPTPLPAPRVNPRRRQQLNDRLETARRGFIRWLTRLKRACRAVEKQQAQIARLERHIQKLEEP